VISARQSLNDFKIRTTSRQSFIGKIISPFFALATSHEALTIATRKKEKITSECRCILTQSEANPRSDKAENQETSSNPEEDPRRPTEASMSNRPIAIIEETDVIRAECNLRAGTSHSDELATNSRN
jgi:hypothetical protein